LFGRWSIVCLGCLDCLDLKFGVWRLGLEAEIGSVTAVGLFSLPSIACGRELERQQRGAEKEIEG